MNTFADIIDRWPSLHDFAADIRVKYGTAQVMRFRSSIDAIHWLDVVSAANRRGYSDVTYDLMARLAAAKKTTAPRNSAGRGGVAVGV